MQELNKHKQVIVSTFFWIIAFNWREKKKSILASKLSFLLSLSISHYLVKYLIKTKNKKTELPGVLSLLVTLNNSLLLQNTMLHTYYLQVSLLYLIPRMEKFCWTFWSLFQTEASG